jgi:hypothetical protein
MGGHVVQPLRKFNAQALLPDPNGIIYPLIEAHFQEERAANPNRPTAAGTRLRASYALDCARHVGFQILGIPEATEIPTEVLFTFRVGNNFHEELQKIILERIEGSEIERVIDMRPMGVDLSCHADALYELEDGAKVVVEIKSQSGYGFMICVGSRRSDEGPGPKDAHVVQAAISALGVDAQYVHLIYFDKDRNGMAEWLLDMDVQLARYGGLSPRELAEAEIERLNGILGRLDEGKLPARHIPGYGRVEIPPEPDSKDQPWNCRYCRHQPICKDLPATPIPIDDIAHLIPVKEEVPSGHSS